MNRGGCIRGVSLGELLEHRPRYEAASSGHRVVGFVPETVVIDVSYDMEKVALLEGELLRSLGTVLGCSADDACRRRQAKCGSGKRWAGDGG